MTPELLRALAGIDPVGNEMTPPVGMVKLEALILDVLSLRMVRLDPVALL